MKNRSGNFPWLAFIAELMVLPGLLRLHPLISFPYTNGFQFGAGCASPGDPQAQVGNTPATSPGTSYGLIRGVGGGLRSAGAWERAMAW